MPQHVSTDVGGSLRPASVVLVVCGEGEKKGFRCDCGNACFRQAGRLGGQLRCTLRAEGERRDETNAGNAYNHNFMDRYASATHRQQHCTAAS